jgi:hypothetical protein
MSSVALALATALRGATVEPATAVVDADTAPTADDAVKDADTDPNLDDTAKDADTSTPDVPPAPSATTTTVTTTSTTAPPRVGPKATPSEAALARESTVVPRDRTRNSFGKSRPGTKQRFAFEIKLGPYLPEVDSRYTGSGFGPYATIFGRTDANGRTVKKPKLGIMPVAHFEWQIVYLGGPLGLGAQIGFFRDRAKALFAMPEDDDLRSNADEVTFGMVPMALLAVYRFELLADFYRVPLVPYAKAGIAYSFWWMRDGSKKVAVNEQGERGRGGVVGWQLNPGIALRLDFIERNAAKKLDQATGINHTYVFGEFQLSRLRNFGIGNSIDLGDKTFFGGLAIEF